MSNRYQREIEEILGQVNDDTPADQVGAKRRQLTQQGTLKAPGGGSRLSFSTGRLMLMGVGLLVLSLPLGAFVPVVAAPAALLGIALFIGAYVVFFSKPRSRSSKMWRGENIEDLPMQSGLHRFWGWLTRG